MMKYFHVEKIHFCFSGAAKIGCMITPFLLAVALLCNYLVSYKAKIKEVNIHEIKEISECRNGEIPRSDGETWESEEHRCICYISDIGDPHWVHECVDIGCRDAQGYHLGHKAVVEINKEICSCERGFGEIFNPNSRLQNIYHWKCKMKPQNETKN